MTGKYICTHIKIGDEAVPIIVKGGKLTNGKPLQLNLMELNKNMKAYPHIYNNPKKLDDKDVIGQVIAGISNKAKTRAGKIIIENYQGIEPILAGRIYIGAGIAMAPTELSDPRTKGQKVKGYQIEIK